MSTTFILITFLLLVSASQQVFAINVKLLMNQNLTDIILKSNDNIIKFPQRSSECFSIYTPKLAALTKDFEDEYLRCQQVADNSTACLHREVQPDAENVVQMRDNICSRLYVCQRNDSNPYDFFECSNEAASQAVLKSYRIQTLSRDKMEYLTMKYELIKYDKYTCTEACSQTYVKGAATIHDELQDCLNGKESRGYSSDGR